MSQPESQLMQEACRGLEDDLRAAILPWIETCRAQRLLLQAQEQDAAWLRWVNRPEAQATVPSPAIVQEMAALVLTKTSTTI